MIKKLLGITSVSTLLFYVSVHAEPFGLKDDPLGMPLSEFKQKYHREVEGHNKNAPFCSDDNPEGAGIKVTTPLIGLTNCKLEFPFEAYRSGPKTSIAGVSSDITYSFISEDTIGFENSKLWSIRATFKHATYTTVRNAFMTKYGDPSKKGSRIIQNAIGASFEREELTWEHESSYIQLLEFGGNITSSEVLYRLKDLEREFITRKQTQDKTRIGDL